MSANVNLTGVTEVPWMTMERLQAMTPYDRALWAIKNLSTEEEAKLITHLLASIMKEVNS